MIEKFSALYPEKIRIKIEKTLSYASFSYKPSRYEGITLVSISFLSIALSIIALFLSTPIVSALTLIGSFIILHIVVIMLLDLIVDKRARLIESVLPDVLNLFSVNLKSGHTTSQALLLSAKPEFGLFKYEIDRIGKEIELGRSFEDAITDLTKRIRSVKLDRVVRLIVSAYESGGKLADLAGSIAEDLRQQKVTGDEVKSQIDIYAVFILVAICVGAPLLYALSTVLIMVINGVIGDASMSIPENYSINFISNSSPVSAAFVFGYVIVALILMVIMGSMMLGLIKDGKERNGLKYIPILLVIAFAVFFFIRHYLVKMMGGLLGV